jgi:hypothetical protein
VPQPTTTTTPAPSAAPQCRPTSKFEGSATAGAIPDLCAFRPVLLGSAPRDHDPFEPKYRLLVFLDRQAERAKELDGRGALLSTELHDGEPSKEVLSANHDPLRGELSLIARQPRPGQQDERRGLHAHQRYPLQSLLFFCRRPDSRPTAS